MQHLNFIATPSCMVESAVRVVVSSDEINEDKKYTVTCRVLRVTYKMGSGLDDSIH
jgi:hypothetical protein